MITVVLKLKEDIVESYVWKDTKKMKQRFQFLKAIKIDQLLLADICIGFVLMNAEAWPE